MRVLITGANGHLGQRLIQRFVAYQAKPIEVVALVRSKVAAAALQAKNLATTIHVVDYRDAESLAAAAAGADTLVHLVGIIKESRDNSFHDAHEQACAALVAALGKTPGGTKTTVKQIIHIGILGADMSSSNACFRSRAAAEDILLSGPIPATVLRVPMVLGKDDAASRHLAGQGSSAFCFTFRGDCLEQPIDSDDIIEAIFLACVSEAPPETTAGILELAGPESLSRAELIRRAGVCLAQQAGRRANRLPFVISLPIGLGNLLASLLELGRSQPPVTRAMLGVLDHDDRVDINHTCQLLGLKLTPLDETLSKVLLE